jgi:hypothetical protein
VVSLQSEFRWAEAEGVLLPGGVAEHLELAAEAELMVTPLPAAPAREDADKT